VLSLGGGQINTLETALSISVLQRLDLQHGAALALLQILFTAGAYWVSRIGGTNPLSFDAQIGKSKPLDSRDLPAAVLTFLVIAFLVILPLSLVLIRAFISSDGSISLANFALLDSRGYRDLLNVTFVQAAWNSFRNLVISTFLAMLIGGITSYLLAERSRRKDRIGVLLDGLFLMPIGVSAVVLGLGYLITFSGDFAVMRSSWLVVPIVQSVLAIPLVIRILYPAFSRIDEAPREQARTDGAKSFQVFQYIDLALIRPAVKTAIVFSALVSLGEFGIASLLSYGDQSTVPMLLYQLIARPGNQNYEMALAVAALLTGITTALVLWVSKETKPFQKKLQR
jgi:thiamine transport system permease protein